MDRTRAARGRALWLTGIILATVTAQTAGAQDPQPTGGSSRLRPTDQRAAQLLQTGIARSSTFRTIVDTLEHSDLIVWVETRHLLRLPGQLQLLAATPICRHVRISVNVPGLDVDEIAWLAHELWHAVEIAGARDVTDQASLQRFYERIGDGGGGTNVVESAKAQDVWTKVRYEIETTR